MTGGPLDTTVGLDHEKQAVSVVIMRRAGHSIQYRLVLAFLVSGVFSGIDYNETVPPLPSKARKVLMCKVNPLRSLQHTFRILYVQMT